MGKDLEISRLCDAYGALLTEHQSETLRDFYDYDLSLAEIAENRGITRQAALCRIRQAEKQLKEYESKLKLVERMGKLIEELTALKAEVDCNKDAVKSILDRILFELGADEE